MRRPTRQLGFEIRRLAPLLCVVISCAGAAPPESTIPFDPDAQRVPLERTAALAATPDSEGPGWQINGGHFQSAVSGLSIEENGQWNFRTQGLTSRSAEFALAHSGGLVFLALGGDTHRELTEDAAAMLVAGVAEQIGPATGHAVTLTIRGGSDVQLAHYEGDRHAAYAGVWVDGSRAFVFELLHPLGERELAEAAFGELPAIGLMEEDALEILRASMRAPLRAPHLLSGNSSMRRGEFRAYGSGIRAQFPEGIWGAQISTGVLFQATELISGITFTLGQTRADEEMTAERAHELLRDELFGEMATEADAESETDAEDEPSTTIPAAESITIGGVAGRVTEAAVGEGLSRERRRGITLEHGVAVVWWTVTASEPAFAQGAALIGQVEAGLGFGEASSPLVISQARVRDLRVGVEFSIPDGFEVQPPIEAPTHGVYLLQRPESPNHELAEVVVFAFIARDPLADERIERIRARTFERLGGSSESGTSTGVLDGDNVLSERRVGGLRVLVAGLGDPGAASQVITSLEAL